MMRGRLVSLVIHIAIVALLFVSSRPAGKRGKESTARLVRSHVLLVSRLAMHGGGGGGEHSPLPPSPGRLPRPAHHQFVPPTTKEVDLRPKLVIEPTSVDRKSTRLNSSHSQISYAVFCLKKKNIQLQ